MPPKSAARSTLRMLKKLEFDELMDRFEVQALNEYSKQSRNVNYTKPKLRKEFV